LNKAPDAFRTISEVADELDLPQHVLRFWESRFPHIKPMKRGGGRRYYRPDDVDLLRGIRHLLYGDGYTIRGVQRILREQGVRAVQLVGQGHAVALPGPSSEDEGDGPDAVPPPSFDAAPRDAEDASEEPAAPVPPNPPKAPPKPPAAAPSPPPGPAGTPAVEAKKGFASHDLDRLKGALTDLEECRRLLDKANEAGS
jgi:DNA-binding transcriptional MerR regulator